MLDDLLTFCRQFPDVQELIRGEVSAAPAHGEVGNGRSREGITTSTPNTATTSLRRLKRDSPDLAEPSGGDRQLGAEVRVRWHHGRRFLAEGHVDALQSDLAVHGRSHGRETAIRLATGEAGALS